MNSLIKSAFICTALGSTTISALAEESLRAEIEFITASVGSGLVDTKISDIFGRYAVNNIHNMGHQEFSGFVNMIIAAGGTITISKWDQPKPISPGDACLAERKQEKELDEQVNGTKGREFYFDTPKNVFGNFGIQEGFALSLGGKFENVKEYNVAGIKGFKSYKGVSAAQQCNDDPECIRELGRFGTIPIMKPHQAKQVSCMGATITDPQLIESISKSIEKTAIEKSNISKNAWDIGQFVTGLRPEDIGIGESTGTSTTDLDKIPTPIKTKIEALVEAYNSSPVQAIIDEKVKSRDPEEFAPKSTKYGLNIVLGF